MNTLQLARFWAKVDKRGDDECWPWLGCRNKLGYGSFGIHSRRTMLAHRVAYEISNGKIPPGVLVCHKCDNPYCVNPKHLFAGSNADNVADCISKGRKPSQPGATNPNAKLSSDQINEIRKLYVDGCKIIPLAKQFGVSKSQIWNIVSGREWNEMPSRAGEQQ